MRIAVWHNLPSGGGKRALYDHVRGLVARGHHVEAWCPPTADPTYLPLTEFIDEHVVLLDWSPEKSLWDLATLRTYAGRVLPAMDEHCRQCAAEINDGQFDILFANSCHLLAASPIGRHVRGPKVLYLGEPARQLYEALPESSWALPPRSSLPGPALWMQSFRDFFKIRGLRLQVREEIISASVYDRILVNSYFSRESVLRAYGLDASVCYLGVDTSRFRADEDKLSSSAFIDPNYVVGVGMFSKAKNIEFVIRAVAQIPDKRPRLIWIGNMVDKNYLDFLLREAAHHHVQFEPLIRVSEAKMIAFLRNAIAFVYAPRLEPFGFTPIEANACGVPVVAVAEGGLRESVINGVTGLLVDHDPHAMAKAVDRIRCDPELAETLRQNGRRHAVEDWPLEKGIDRLETALTQVLDIRKSD